MAVVAEIDQNIQRIQKLVVRRTRLKATAFQRKTLLERRRLENVKRRGQETALEAPDLVRSSGGVNVLSSVASTGKSFFGRILQALAYLGAGWLLNNLPTIIGYGQEFIARLKRGREILSDMWSSIKGTFKALGKVFTTALDNLKNFDFLDSEKKMQREVNNLVDQVNNVGKSFSESYELITKPFVDEQGLGTYSGQPIPQPGASAEAAPAPTAPTAPTESQQMISKPSPKSSSGFIQSLGITNSMWDTYRDTIASIETAGYSLTESYAAIGGSGGQYDGRYQMGAAAKQDAAGLLGIPVPSRSEFRNNPQLQEDMFLAYTYANHTYLMNGSRKYREASPVNRLQYLGYAHNQGWANAANWLATGVADTEDGFGTKGTKFTDALRSSLKKYTTQTTQVQPQTPRMPALPPTNTMAGQNYGDPRDGGRQHAGQDFDAGPNDTFYSRIGGEVTRILKDPNGYGNYVDIYNKRLGVTERIAEGTENLVGIGDKVQPGTPIQRGTHQTGVFHYEIRKGREETYGFKGTLDPLEFLKTITPERKGEQIIMVNRTEASTPTTTMYGKDSNVIIDSLSGLNSYIRKNMLARLADR